MHNDDIQSVRAAMAALESQRAALGDEVLELALAPLRARLGDLLRPAGLQHRQLAVLFVGVVGATAPDQRVPADDQVALLGTALRRMADTVEAHQGRVLRLTDDGIKAVFGMDEAREDDAERAVRAGLAVLAAGRALVQATLQRFGVQGFEVRAGVHSGDVALGAGLEADSTAMGAAVHVAARMQQSAPAGALRISHDTWSQVRGLFDASPQPPLLVKGVDAPMTTYLVRAARDRSAASVERGLQGLATPMVGRDAQLQRLQQALAQARDSRQLQALTLLGDAGLGKSRLLRELAAALGTAGAAGAAGDAVRVLSLRSQPDAMLRPWGLLRALLAAQCAVADTDSADVARRKVVDGLAPCFTERAERQAHLIGQLAGLDFSDSPHLRGLDPRSLRDQAFAALRACLQAWAAPAALLLLLVEDLHWADDSSLDLLQHLLAHAADLPLTLVMTARPALLARRPDWCPPETMLTLGPLAAAHGDALAQALLQRIDTVPPRLTDLIVGRAEGNPYYMEELVRRLIDDGVIDTTGPRWTVQADRLDTVRLPATLVGLLQARLDALPAGQRQAARLASIVGHVFWDDALQALDADAPQALPALQQAAFVRAHATSDFEGTPEHQFDHHLLHQVTYDTLLKAERKLGHGAAARWLQARTQGRGAEFLAMTGEHAERAGEVDLAIDCFEQAGKDARKRFANVAAMSWLQRAIALLGHAQPQRRCALWSAICDIADRVGDRPAQEAAMQELAAILAQHPDDARLAELWFMRGLLADRQADSAAAERWSLQAAELAERCGAARWAAMARGNLAYQHFARQDHASATAHLQTGLQWAARIEAESTRMETEAQLLTVSAMVDRECRRFSASRVTLQAVLARGDALGAQRLQLGALDNLAVVAANLGLWPESIDWAQRMRVLADSIGAAPRVAHADLHLALAAEALGDDETAMRRHALALGATRANGDRTHEAASLQRLGVLHGARGDMSVALAWLGQAQALYQALDDTIGVWVATAHAALCQVRSSQTDQARAAVEQLLAALAAETPADGTHATIEVRAVCHLVLDALADVRATPLLVHLHSDMLARAAQLTDAADRDRLIQALPVFRDVAAAYQRLGAPPAAGLRLHSAGQPAVKR